MVQLLRCLLLAQITPKLHHKVAKRRFIVSVAVPPEFISEIMAIFQNFRQCFVKHFPCSMTTKARFGGLWFSQEWV